MNRFKNLFFRREEAGFTLVELMVVVAIIGILSAVAIPNFKRYQAKSKTSEAKLNLAALYTAETALNGDYDNYGTCLEFMGYSRVDTGTYYAIGFDAKNATADGAVDTNGGLPACSDTISCCNYASAAFTFDASKSVAGRIAAGTDIANTSVVANTGDTFIAEAVGAISSDNTTAFDRWTINQDKNLVQTAAGY